MTGFKLKVKEFYVALITSEMPLLTLIVELCAQVNVPRWSTGSIPPLQIRILSFSSF